MPTVFNLRIACWLVVALGVAACSVSRDEHDWGSRGIVAAALAAVPLDSLCQSQCAVVRVDTAIRVTPTMVYQRPLSAPIAFHISSSDASALVHKQVEIVPGRITQYPIPTDTSAVMVFVVASPDSVNERTVGIWLQQSREDWGVLLEMSLERVRNGWSVAKTQIHEP